MAQGQPAEARLVHTSLWVLAVCLFLGTVHDPESSGRDQEWKELFAVNSVLVRRAWLREQSQGGTRFRFRPKFVGATAAGLLLLGTLWTGQHDEDSGIVHAQANPLQDEELRLLSA